MLKRIVLSVVSLLVTAVSVMGASHRFTLVIDAGHGGHDAGAVGAISKEKNINLRTALAFGRYVERNCPDVNVIYTRKTDVFVTLHGRAEIANKAKADLFVSIHTNAVEKGTVRGLETYTLGMARAQENLDIAKRENSVILVEKDYKQRYQGFDPNSAESYIVFEFMQDRNMSQSVELAKLVQSNVCATASRPNKGVKQAGFLVLRETTMPSCLIELGYISTRDEEQWLNVDANIESMARGIYQAFVAYKNKYDNRGGVPYRPAEQSGASSVPSIVPAENRKNSETTKTTEAAKSAKAEQKQKQNAEVRTKKDSAGSTNQTSTPKKQEAESKNENSAPEFRIQILVSDRVLSEKDSRLKGEKASYFKEGKLVKYTIGASTDYNAVYKQWKVVKEKFPDSFIVAFRNSEKMNVSEAIKEYRNNRK